MAKNKSMNKPRRGESLADMDSSRGDGPEEHASGAKAQPILGMSSGAAKAAPFQNTGASSDAAKAAPFQNTGASSGAAKAVPFQNTGASSDAAKAAPFQSRVETGVLRQKEEEPAAGKEEPSLTGERRGPGRERTASTRDRLIESARYLFWERGFAGTSMADLLEHSKVNSGSFYHFFESKEALLREVLQGYLGALRPMVVDPAFARTDEPVERIFAILAGYRERILMTDCQYGCPLGRLALEIDPENRPAHKLIAENFQGWIGAVRECVDQLSDRLPASTDPEALATYVLAVMEGGVMLSRSYRTVEPFDRAVQQLREHFRLLLRT